MSEQNKIEATNVEYKPDAAVPSQRVADLVAEQAFKLGEALKGLREIAKCERPHTQALRRIAQKTLKTIGDYGKNHEDL